MFTLVVGCGGRAVYLVAKLVKIWYESLIKAGIGEMLSSFDEVYYDS